MGEVCRHCGGKGWIWNGHARVWCGACAGHGARELPPEKRGPDGPGGPHDPSRDR
jgi:hypothetical protein